MEDLGRITFSLFDGRNTTNFKPNFNVCACKEDTLCNYDAPVSSFGNGIGIESLSGYSKCLRFFGSNILKKFNQ